MTTPTSRARATREATPESGSGEAWSRHLVVRLAWLAVGLTALALGALGVALPLLPTTPFVLLAAFAFARSSTRMHRWLHEHRIFGPLIDDWARYGAIGRNAKLAGLASLIAVFAFSVWFGVRTEILIVHVIVLGACGAFIATRPSPPGDRTRED